MIKIKRLYLSIGLVSALLFLHTANAASTLKYHEVASTVMMNSLQTQPRNSFLKKFYTQLFFVPVWMSENAPSSSAKALFKHIKNDDTLNKNGKLYQDTLRLEGKVQDIYKYHGKLIEKVDLEFKISQLYKAYTDYAYLGSINWGAFQARISNLIVNGVSTEWILHRPRVNAIAMAEKAALGADLGKELEKATPTQYHYRALQEQVAKYRKIKANGGWGTVPLTRILRRERTLDL